MSAQEEVPALKFAEEHVEPILAGRKTATLRLDLDKPLSIGDRFRLCTPDGERFASAIVSDKGYQSIYWIVRLGIDGHRDYVDEEECIEHLSKYYPDRLFSSRTCLDIVYWEEIWQ